MAAVASSNHLNTSGKLFFSSLVATTFGLGVWQTRRYFEKEELLQQREQTLALPPVLLPPYSVCDKSELRGDASPLHRFEVGFYPPLRGGVVTELKELTRVNLIGSLRCKDTILVGPRGPPPGALGKSGPNAAKAGQGGMSTSPQGYYLITPLRRLDGKGTVLVNRGWIPKSMQDRTDIICAECDLNGIVNVTGVVAKMEQPKRFSPNSRSSMMSANSDRTATSSTTGSTPKYKKLLWMDRVAIEEETHTMGLYPPYIIQTKVNNGEGTSVIKFPVQPDVSTVGEFKVTPATHAGYAITWFSLSGFGLIMTRKLILRGR
jgi:cytochrome oxidase assembly protein ShyY1